MANIIDAINKKEIERIGKVNPTMKIGDLVEASYLTSSGEKRIFKGVIIDLRKRSIMSSVTIIRTASEKEFRMQKTFLLHSPNVDFKVISSAKTRIRKSKLYYLTSRYGKTARI